MRLTVIVPLLVLLLSGCLVRQARPPAVTLSAAPWEEFAVPVAGLLVQERVLLAWAGDRLLFRQGDMRLLRQLPGRILSAARSGGYTAVVLENNRVLILDDAGHARNGEAGTALPESVPVPLTVEAVTPPILATREGGAFILCGSKGGVYRVAAPEWRPLLLWQAKKGITAPPGFFPGGWAVGAFTGELAFFTNGAKAPARVLTLPAIPDSSPLFLSGNFIITSREPHLYRHDFASGAVRQKNGLPLWVNELMLLDGKLVGRFWRAGLFACEPGGRMKNTWRHPSAAGLTLPLVDGFALYCGAADGVLRALFRYNGGLMGSLRLGQDPVLRPVRFGGMVLAACGTRLYRIRLTAQDDPVW